MKSLSIFLLGTLFISSISFAISGKVQAVQDGDTISIIQDGTKERVSIRLMGVDAPEMHYRNQSQGEPAKKAFNELRRLLPKGTAVRIHDDYQTDKYGRILGRIFREDGLDVNSEMLRTGLASFYFIHPFDKRALSDYSKACQEAYVARRGLYEVPDNQVDWPYVFRMRIANMKGFNLLGNLADKSLHKNEELEKVPPCLRVFFPGEKAAKSAGYNWN